ncbi:MAG: 23S rRNA (adenine(2503)-C(2))-methyltransferase RlmN [Bacteroidetes bacterium]|jgi:23S rRNA (adenine2503-C2)-methyltransferase|nr:23S rRNA (adenine(2503)-C(2))-methyltransferase RlmN [Bacteroidota bacterium]MCB0603520.1 23S rRNA (adenine(2503)-C(2))-methyltransferase RlmN [Saprospiraceae bacterium]MCO5278330.1 23S rRNA (adenine(2503)-C(2))-methyltransferase RlmN [Saprospiraceae bacterium]HMT77417.1 23S rRNA (adenine(2503)-C(2))-methyltransferase RlmN [Saprospiraceae bacterium]
MAIDIRLYSPEKLEEWLIEHGEPKFRLHQIFEWIWKKHALSFDEMTNLSTALRAKLNESFLFKPMEVDLIQKSNDGTIKTRLKLYDGHLIETVLIPVPEENRYTACVSSQVGCSLACKFCATGMMGRIRNLDYPEIIDQVVHVNRQALEYFDHVLTNIVYMGMGEPLLNYSNTIKSIELITSPKGLGMSPSRITVSTAGIAKMIKRLADDGMKVNLALSLHAANDNKRNEIMPINDQNSISVLMEALHYFYQKTKNRITYEYLALRGFNDQIEDAEQLAALTKDFPVRVNIIEYNTVEGIDFHKTDTDQLNKFVHKLVANKVNVTVRRSRGKDIDAACGQLANK